MVVAEDPDELLADLGAELAARVGAALPGWVLRCVDSRLPAATPDRDAVMARAEVAARRARREVEVELRALLASDVDAQRSTPLSVVRAAVSYPTEVLLAAQVPPVPRDGFVSGRFPHDPYGLNPASLRAVHPDLGEVAIAWGAAKAMAHRQRHGTPDEFT
ncbi:MAG TPA: hypothetical protein VK215_00845 [Acidimicrobiales bacterium]|nr:hypothetical protein [Acidimicrobiales bacterium]